MGIEQTYNLKTTTKKSWLPWCIWVSAALLFFTEYFIRISPAVMTAPLMHDFQIGAFTLGSLSACFYYPYVAMQIPVGLLIDKFGPHRLLTLMALLCALSCLLFAHAASVIELEASRFFMGFAAAFAFVGSIKLATNWFPARRIGMLAGFTQSLGMLGAAVGSAPLALVVASLGWRSTMDIMGAIFLVQSAVLWFVVRDKPAEKEGQSTASTITALALWQGFKKVLSNKQTWLNALYAGLCYAPVAAFAEFWGVSDLHYSYDITISKAAFGIGLIFIGWGIGGPIVGWLSDHMRKRRPIMFVSAILSCIVMIAILYMPFKSEMALFVLLFLYGVVNTGVGVSYAMSTEINPRKIAGTSLAFTNMMSVLIGALLQPIIGFLIQHHWDGASAHGVAVYSKSDFHVALLVLPISLLLAAVFALLVKETHCQPYQEPQTESVDGLVAVIE